MINSILCEITPLRTSYVEFETIKLRPGILSKFGGVFQRAESKNANDRVYPRSLWQKILSDPSVKERIENRRMIGMLGHPESGVTDLEKAAIVITMQELREDDSIYGEAEILDTPMGRIMDSLLRARVGLGISSRGDGSVEKKGDHSEVTNDYQLETYDAVLKPSTLGAYPEMIPECSVSDNEKKVVYAIEGLVNREDIPKSQRTEVLTECLKILNGLEAEETSKLTTPISKKITEELESRSVISVSAKEDVNELKSKLKLEDLMKNGQNPGTPAMTSDTLAWHKQAICVAQGNVARVKEQEISQLKDTVVKAQREHTETRKRLKAAESLIDDFSKEVKKLRESRPADKRLSRRYEAAVKLLDEALKRLPEIRILGRRCKTLEGLVSAGFTHILEDRQNRAIKEHLAKIHPSYHESVRPVLKSCRTIKQIAEAFKAFAIVSGDTSVSTRRIDPLPSKGTVSLSKSRVTESAAPTQKSQSYANLLGNRLSKAV